MLPAPERFSASETSTRVVLHAGNEPAMIPVTQETRTVNASTLRIHVDLDPERQLDRNRRRDNIDEPIGEQDAGGAAEQREDRAFRQQLSRETRAARAERRPNE